MPPTSASASLQTATLLGRLRGTRGLWAFVALALLAPVILWLEWQVVRAEAAAHDVGLDVQRSASKAVRVAINDGRWVGVEQGDTLVEFQGEPIVTHDDFWRLRISAPEGPLRATFEREGRRFEVRSHTTPTHYSLVVAYALRLLTGALLLLIALGAFLMRPGGAVSWLFLLFVYSVATVTMLTVGFLSNGHALYLIIYSLLALAPVFGLLLFTVFPRKLNVGRAHLALIVTPGLLITFANPVRLFLFPDVSSYGLEVATRGWTTLACLALFVGQGWQMRKARKEGDLRLASLYRLLVIATFAGLFAPVLFSSISRVLKIDGSFAMEVSATLVLAFAVLMGDVLVRHNPLAVDRYATSVVGYVVTVGALGVAFAVGMLGLPLLAERFGLTRSSEALVAVTAAVTLSIGPVYRRLRRVIDRWFSEEQADVMQTAAVLQRVADAVQRESRERALQVIVESLRVLGVESAARWHLDAHGRELQRTQTFGDIGSLMVLPRDEAVADLLEHAGGVAALTPTAASARAQQLLWSLGLVYAAPVRAHSVAVGFLGVGRRPSGFSLRPEDEAFVATLAAKAGLALERGDQVTTIGRYRIERRLASGGMAEIFVAWQLGPGGFERKVALKRLLPELAEDPRHAASLLDEASITARLSHENIARIFEVGLEGGQHFIAMEYVDGPPLRALLAASRKRGEPVTLDVFLAIARALLAALEHAHTVADLHGQPLGVVHRDVTPSNLLLTAAGEVKLVDFGLVYANARLFRTQTGVARGTMPYMSPEQAAGESRVDARTDVYSAAATLYELLTFERAFPEGPYNVRPRPASVVRPALPPAVDAVFERAMSLAVEDRFPSARAFWDALFAALAAEPASNAKLGEWVKQRQGEIVEAAPTSQPERVAPDAVTRTGQAVTARVDPGATVLEPALHEKTVTK